MPYTLQKKLLREFHIGHPGMTKMKSLIGNPKKWPRMDQDIEKIVKEYRGCQLAAKAPPIKIWPGPKTDAPWMRLHIDYAGPLNGHYHLIIVDSFSKWLEIFKCRHPTSTNTLNVLNELFSRNGTPKALVSDSGTQFTGREFKDFCTSLSIDHITTSVYHSRSNGLSERFMDTFKRALRKNQAMDTDERNIQKFLAVYRITTNLKTDSNLSPAERKIWSVFARLLPSPKKKVKENFATKFYKPGDRVFFRNFRGGKNFWEDGIITKRLGRGIYMLKRRRFECKRRLNQLRPRYIKDVTKNDREELPMELIYDAFEIPVPISPLEPMELTPPMTEVPVPRKLLIPQIPPSIRKKKSQTTLSRLQKEVVLSKLFMGKFAQEEVL